MDRKAYVGRTDTTSICLTEDACYDILDVIMKYDPDGVENGDYFIDIDEGESD